MASLLTSLPRKMRVAGWRVYQDFLMPNRLDDYRNLLEAAAENGYQMLSVEQWAALIEQRALQAHERYFVLRHDVDTDPTQMLLTIGIERVYKAQASYFFRLSTMDPRVVREVADAGFHVSYHFEELAAYAKEMRLTTGAQVQAKMPQIRRRFLINLSELRRRFALPMDIVCSHGDWMNRRLGIMNHAILADPEFRIEAGIRHETYDAALMAPMNAYISDQPAPVWWRPASPIEAVRQGVSPLGLLTHPRQWRPSILNAHDIAVRTMEGLSYRFGGGQNALR